MKKPNLKILIPDTNIYLHYHPFDQIDWAKESRSQKVILLVPGVVISELNKNKDQNPRQHLRERAAKIIRLLKNYSGCVEKDSAEVRVRDNTFIEFSPWSRQFNLESYGLDAACADDKVLAMALLLIDEKKYSDAEIIIVTDDINLELKAKSFRISVLSLPEKFKMPAQNDAEKKQIQQLEKQIREIELSKPQLSVKFVDGRSASKYELPKPLLIPSPFLFWDLLSLKNNYPPWQIPAASALKSLSASTDGGDSENSQRANFEDLMRQLKEIPPVHVQMYNHRLEEFYQAYAKYRNDHVRYENERNLILPCDFVLVNEGTVPAKDIDLFFQAPKGASFLFENDFPQEPLPPVPPEPPQEIGRMIGEGIVSVLRRVFVASPKTVKLYLPPQNDSGSASETATSLTISKDKRQLVCKVKYLKHNMFYSFRFYLRLNSYAAKSLSVGYSALVANIQQKIEGSLHFVIEK